MKIKERRERKKKRNPSIWARVQQSLLECRETPFSGRLVKYLQPAVIQLNIEGTTASKISMVERLAHKTEALVILLQETHCTCIDKLVISNFALAGSIPSRKHGLTSFVHESLSWTLAGWSPKDSEIEWLCMDVTGLKIINVYKPPS